MPRISVAAVVTTHRRPDKLAVALRSVLEQTHPVDEIIVVEHGADEGTALVVSAATRGGARIRHLRVGLDRCCPAASRNVALGVARSTHVAFLDDDDTWHPHKNASQVAGLAGAHLSCGNAMRTDGLPYFPPGPDRLITGRELNRHNPIITSTVLVDRRALLAAGGFREIPGLHEDFDAWLRLFGDAGCFRYQAEILSGYESSEGDRLSANRLRSEVRLVRVRCAALIHAPLSLGAWLALARACGGVVRAALPG